MFKSITRNFDEAAVMGAGSFGRVYRGEWTDRGTGPVKEPIRVRVAVKRLDQDSFQGYAEWLVSFQLNLKSQLVG